MEPEFNEKRFAAEAEYAESIFQTSIGNINAAIDALERTLGIDDEYAPSILSMGSVEYQRGEPEKGMGFFYRLYHSR